MRAKKPARYFTTVLIQVSDNSDFDNTLKFHVIVNNHEPGSPDSRAMSFFKRSPLASKDRDLKGLIFKKPCIEESMIRDIKFFLSERKIIHVRVDLH